MLYVISGASRGIGLELTKQALEQGHRVVAGVRSPAKSEGLRGLHKAHPAGKLDILSLDVTSDDGVRTFASAVSALGITSVDVLINNAGVYLDGEDTLESLSSRTLTDTFNTNTLGPFRLTQALLPLLHESEQPKVACISSLMGSIADNGGGGSYAYRMSKAALNMFVKGLSLEERGLIALTLHPGWVKTEMGGSRAPLEPAKSAEGLLTVIQSATSADSGKFLNHAGRELPW